MVTMRWSLFYMVYDFCYGITQHHEFRNRSLQLKFPTVYYGFITVLKVTAVTEAANKSYLLYTHSNIFTNKCLHFKSISTGMLHVTLQVF